jgi:DnaJ family protein C protein 9
MFTQFPDKNRKALYDEQGIIDDDDDKFGSSWLEAFKSLFKPISDEDIDNYQKTYVGSDLEKSDIKRSYLNGKGCINYIHDHVPFLTINDEPRVIEIVKGEFQTQQLLSIVSIY